MHSILQALNVLLKRQAWGVVEEEIHRFNVLEISRLRVAIQDQLEDEDLT